MKVRTDMIHEELRGSGKLIRKFLKFKSVKTFKRINYFTALFLKGNFPKAFNVEQVYLTRQDGSELRVLVCSRKITEPNATGLLWLHGGGYAIGLPEQAFVYVKHVLTNSNSVVILPDYTRSTEKPFPAALEDAYLALLWLKENANRIGVNGNQLFIAGESAGGGLAVAVSLYARDYGQVNLAFQMPLYPMLDDRMVTHSSKENDAPVWDSDSNKLAWQLYLGEDYETKNVSPYAAPSRVKDYSNLPPAYTFVGGIEPFRDETVEYIKNLKKANIVAKIDIYPGCFHAFDLVGARSTVGAEATQKWISEYIYATKNFYAAN